jgi:hypothetical protein
MKNNIPHPVVRGKIFAVAPMMDWTDNLKKSFG